jgi:DNA polymerase (family 10)
MYESPAWKASYSKVSILDNAQIVETLLAMATALEFLEDNPFKAKAYQRAAQSISELDVPVEELIDNGEISEVPGVGQTIGAMLTAWVKHHDFSALENLRAQIPAGLEEMWKVPGIGIKKLRLLHHVLGINDLNQLLTAIDDGRISTVKGFSQKSIDRLRRSIHTVLAYRGWFLLDTAWAWARTIFSSLEEAGLKVEVTGSCRRATETINTVDLLIWETDNAEVTIRESLDRIPGILTSREGGSIIVTHKDRPLVKIMTVPESSFIPALFITTGSDTHVEQIRQRCLQNSIHIGMNGVKKDGQVVPIRKESDIYDLIGAHYLPPEVREGRDLELDHTMKDIIPRLVTLDDLRGTIHVHTTHSDGKATLREMVKGAIERGYAWIGISDHSKSAFYAGGLKSKELLKVSEEIDHLNESLAGITILKGAESDILADGSLDYPPEILSKLDFVIASIHSLMEMDRESMTSRIIKAIRNPYTSILGHPTGRVLLSRDKYEVDMEAVLEEAARNHVAVELNANPMRLDIDWRLIHGFISMGGRIVIAPDAHTVAGLDDVVYGVAIARKGLATKDACLNVLDATRVKEVFTSRWK